MKIIITFFSSILISGCATQSDTNQTHDFRHFVRQFFANPDSQIEHVQFPLEVQFYEFDAVENDLVLKSRFIEKENWEPYSGPEFYRCQMDCYDLVIYDNFNKKQTMSGERVLSFEGVNNGINSSLFFQLLNGKWILVKQEQFDN